jgi:hypothetical protein
MRSTLVPSLVALAMCGLACEQRTTVPTPGPGPGRAMPGPGGGPAPADAGPSQSRPSKEEVIEYLDGKELDLAKGRDAGKGEAKHVIRKDQIEALQVADSATSVNNGPWSVQIDFILNTGMGRYAVTGRVEHKLVDQKRAFFGFLVEQVARQ